MASEKKTSFPENFEGRRIKVYDFKRPDKFSREQIRTVSILHETFARLSTASLSATLRTYVKMHVRSVDQLTYQEFILSIPNPTTLAIINMDPLKGNAILEFNPEITFPIIDRIVGGKGEWSGESNYTDIEFALIEGIYLRLLGNLREAWSNIIDLRPRLGTIETVPMFAQIVPPTEMVVVVTFEISINESKPIFVNFCIPYLTIEPLIPKLSAAYWYSQRSSTKNFQGPKLSNLKVDSEIYIPCEKIQTKQLLDLQKGFSLDLPNYEKGYARLKSGESEVLSLENVAKNKAREFSFSILDEEESDPDEVLFFGEEVETKNPLEETLTDLKDQFREGLNGFSKKLNELEKNQMALFDSISYASSGSVPQAEASSTLSDKPFSFLNSVNLGQAYVFLQHEMPQTIALILSHLSPTLAGQLLAAYPEDKQVLIAKCIATIDWVAPGVIEEISRILTKNISQQTQDEVQKKGGIETVVNILNLASRSTEKLIIESIESSDSELAEEIKKRMFVFEDSILIDQGYIQVLIEHVDQSELFLALKTVNDEVLGHFTSAMSKEQKAELLKYKETSGKVLLSEVEAAQTNIVQQIRELEEDGIIKIARADDEVV
jgi:flagellar motor switch protein FliM